MFSLMYEFTFNLSIVLAALLIFEVKHFDIQSLLIPVGILFEDS